MTAAFVSTLLLLGIVGWSAGWVAAGNDLERQGHVDASASVPVPKPTTPSPTPVRSSASPSPTNPASPTTPSRPDQFAMPNLINMDFLVARALAMEKRLGVAVMFNEPSSRPNGNVVKTLPEPGVWVWPGVTIKLLVAGPPPKVSVPDIVGRPCGEGKDAVLDVGLKIQGYPSGERGNVVKVEPGPGTTLSWNDEVKLYCA